MTACGRRRARPLLPWHRQAPRGYAEAGPQRLLHLALACPHMLPAAIAAAGPPPMLLAVVVKGLRDFYWLDTPQSSQRFQLGWSFVNSVLLVVLMIAISITTSHLHLVAGFPL